MKILLVYTGRKSGFGGAETFTFGLLSALRRRRFDCELFWIGVAPAGLCTDNITIGTLAAELVDTVHRRKIDVVHAAVGDWDSGLSLLKRMCPKVALVVTNHGEVVGRWSSRYCDAVVGCSAWTAAAQQATTDLRVHAILNGINTERFVPAASETTGGPIVGWVGRGSCWEKGLDQFAAVAPALKRGGVKIWIADYDGPSKVLPEAAGLLKPVADRWEGIPQDQMPAFYQQIAASGGCVMLTARSEGLPLRLLEAQACG